jgi:hypothetical protein
MDETAISVYDYAILRAVRLSLERQEVGSDFIHNHKTRPLIKGVDVDVRPRVRVLAGVPDDVLEPPHVYQSSPSG